MNNYWKELFSEKEMKIDHVIATTMSIDQCEMIKIMALAKHYERTNDDNPFSITNLMIDSMLVGNGNGWVDKFDFYYDNKNGQIINSKPGYLSETVTNKICSNRYLHPISINGVFHSKIILVRFTGDNKVKWKVLVTSHNLTLSQCYENAILLKSCDTNTTPPNHNLGAFLNYLDSQTSSERLNNYADEIKGVRLEIVGAENEVFLEVSGISHGNNKPFEFYDDLKNFQKKTQWKVVSPDYETGNCFQKFVFGPVDDKGAFIPTHSKMYFKIVESRCTELWMGSANCSDNGLNGTNVECLVKIKAPSGFSLPNKANEGFSFQGVNFKNITNFIQRNYDGSSLINQILSGYDLNLTFCDERIPRMEATLERKINEVINCNGYNVKLIPVGYPEKNATDISAMLSQQTINLKGTHNGFCGTKGTGASYVMRIIVEKGYERIERLWPAIPKNYDNGNLFFNDIEKNILNFNASEFVKDEVRRKEFCELWRALFEQRKGNIDKQNQLDRILRNYIDAMRACKISVNIEEFVHSNTETELAEYQEDAVKQAFRRLVAEDGSKRFLIADEAGLGKTYIAKGIIDEFQKKKKDFIRVIYFASNLYLLKKTGEKIVKERSGWHIAEKIDRVSMITPITSNTTSLSNGVNIYMVSGNIYGNSSKSGCGNREERSHLGNISSDDEVATKRKYALNELIANEFIDLIICDEFHRYAEAAKEISSDWGDTPIVFLSATPYNWFNSQLTMFEGGFEDKKMQVKKMMIRACNHLKHY